MAPGEPVVVDDDEAADATESQMINEVRRLVIGKLTNRSIRFGRKSGCQDVLP